MRPVLLAGPTASGKSDLALRIAERDGGCVINADALQVYGCWRILTARPTPQQQARAPHALYGHIGCDQRYSVGAWLADLKPILDDLEQRSCRAIIVGGTGLYLSALTEGLAPVPEVPPALRRASQAQLDAGNLRGLLEDLARDDPETFARIDRNNPARVQRAWEVLRATGRGLSEWQRAPAPPLIPPAACVRIVLSLDKARLDQRIKGRFHAMLAQGALEEVDGFRTGDCAPSLPAARALGARELAAHLEGTLSRETAIAQSVTATRQFAKRQRTWFRSRMSAWDRIDATEAGENSDMIPRN